MLPGRLGLRFALEALFLVLLAIGAGLADLRPGFIVLVMAIAWLLVAIIEYTAERISASPLYYVLPQRGDPPVDEAEAAWPMPEERTVVAPPERPEPEAEARIGTGSGARAGTAARRARAQAGAGAREPGTAALAPAPPRAGRGARAFGAAPPREAAPAPLRSTGEPGFAGGRRALRQAR